MSILQLGFLLEAGLHSVSSVELIVSYMNVGLESNQLRNLGAAGLMGTGVNTKTGIPLETVYISLACLK